MKKANLIVCVVMVATMLLPACGGGTVATQPPAGATQPSGQKVNLVYWSMWNKTEPQAIALTSIIGKFEAANPNITIEAVWNGRENQTKVRTALGSNTPIDLADQDEDQIAGGLVLQGMALPLDDILNAPALGEDVLLKDLFYPGMVDLFSKDGVHYLLPYADQPVMFIYNKAIFTAAGIAAPPATWDEFLADAQKIKDAGYVPIASEGDVADYAMFYFTYLVERMAGKGFLLNAIMDKTGQAWLDPTFLQAMTMVRELWDKGFIPPESVGYQWPAGQQTLATGIAAMELCGSWLPEELNPLVAPDFKWGGFPFPAVAGGTGSIDDLQQWQFAFIILKNSAHPKEAGLFLKFLMTKESQAEFSSGATYGVTRPGVDWPKDIVDSEAASASAKVVFTHADGGTALYPEFTNNVLFANYLNAYIGQMTPAEFVQKMADDSKAYWANK